MKRATFITVFSLLGATCFSQDTYQIVYNIFQTNCATSGCHTNASQSGGLDLEGSGGNPSNVVYNNLVDVAAQNTTSQSMGHKRVFAGDPYRSMIFRKVQHIIETSELETGEGDEMPKSGSMTIEEAETIRQWIVFGAPQTGSIVDTSLISDYYAGNAVDGITTPIAAPPSGEGMQIRLGPFFVEPSGEIEYYSKYPLMNNTELEIRKVDADLGQNYSHHFIAYKYTGNEGNYAEGLRPDASHYDNELIAAYQTTGEINLPPGTAFFWDTNTYLDLNTHYINYSNDKVLKAENYFNVYTQPNGTAVQEMLTDLYPNVYIYIPNDGLDHSFDYPVYDSTSSDEIFIWAMSSHTHQWGTDFDIFERDINGNIGDQIYDAEHSGGDPFSFFVGYDYQHPPTRYWEYPFKTMKRNEGFIQRATYNNTGSQPVFWGETSEDEMMITGLMFLDDTTGVGGSIPFSIKEEKQFSSISVYPNPTTANTRFVTDFENDWSLKITDLVGREVYNEQNIKTKATNINFDVFPAGAYMYQATQNGKTVTGKILKD